MKGSAGKPFVLVFLLSILAGIVLLIVRRGAADGSPGGLTQQVFRPEPKYATILVPSWADPIPPGKNVLWCASFQLAWDRLKADVAHGPVLLEGADAAALNASEIPEGDLPSGSYYAAAGRGPEVLARIRDDMARLFPTVLPDLTPQTVEIAAYAYLRAGVRFDPPFFDSRKPLLFSDGSGRTIGVNAFGVRPEDEYAYNRLRERVEVVFETRDRKNPSAVPEFVVDPCRTSAPNQILLAMVPRRKTLRETWAYVRTKLLPDGPPLMPNDTLLVPNIRCEMVQEFEALEGRRLRNPGLSGMRIDVARQAIEFRLNRGGAELGSEAQVMAVPVPTHYHFDRPFLVVMRKRGADHPFFLLWVDNREILE
jgi:hypothetical protein